MSIMNLLKPINLATKMISIHYSNYKSFLDIHSESVLEYCNTTAVKYSIKKLDALVKKHFASLVCDFE